MAATQHVAPPAEDRPRAALRAGPPAHRAWVRSTPASSHEHTDGLRRRSPEHVADFTLERVAAETGVPAEQLRPPGRRPSPAGGRVSFWWTMGVNQSHQGVRTAQAIIDLALHDRQHRPARHRRQLDHRPVQRHGLAAVLQHDRHCSAATTSPTPSTARGRRRPRHRRDAHPRPRRAGRYDRIIEGIVRGEIQGLWVIATNGAHSWINQSTSHRGARPARLPGRAGHVRHHRDRPAGRPRAARRRVGREGGHVHQLRAPARPGEAGVRRRPARRSPTSTSSRPSPTRGGAGTCSPTGPIPRPSSRSSRS